ncbi:hypothetical protein MMC32_005017 [Xylographa parallela]|nr:hypothetical protein [Xylographa parallela]
MGYTFDTCCDLALSSNAFIPPTNFSGTRTCGQIYNANLPPAESSFISYPWCAKHCPGFGLSQGQNASQWADGFVQFILPSVIFSMTIPRQQKIGVSRLFDYFVRPTNPVRALQNVGQLVLSMFASVCLVLPFVALDTISWMAMIFVGAGPMLLSGMFEALVDYRVMSAITVLKIPGRNTKGQSIQRSPPRDASLTRDEIVELLTIIVCGNLMLDVGDPHRYIVEKLGTENGEEVKTRLLHMMSAQNSFGSTIGAPVLFYLGAFVYTILNLFSNPSSEDGAISIALGVEWMIIVHVAIVSGCLLASNNPSTTTAVVGLSPAIHPTTTLYSAPTIASQSSSGKHSTVKTSTESRYRRYLIWWGVVRPKGHVRHLPLFDQCFETRFQPVWLWRRGHNKMEWIRRSKAWRNHPWFQKEIHLSPLNWLLYLYIPTMILIVFPPGAGGFVAYDTPPIGFACRSLTLCIYAGCQIVLTTIAAVHAASESHKYWENKVFVAIPWFLTAIAMLFSLFTGIGGSMMQIMGVYRNCICYVNAQYWLSLDASPGIDVATDTQGARESSANWLTMGYTATAFMALVCYMGYRYQLELRYHFAAEVEALDYSTTAGPAARPLTPEISSNGSVAPLTGQGPASSSPGSTTRVPAEAPMRTGVLARQVSNDSARSRSSLRRSNSPNPTLPSIELPSRASSDGH